MSLHIFAMRRIIDIAESAGDPLMLLFLDWAKAFDSIKQEELILAVKRMNVPETIVRELTQFYLSPRFRIKDVEGYSTSRRQRNGIRQGCPLSPYLFIIVMTTMMYDVNGPCLTRADADGKRGLLMACSWPGTSTADLLHNTTRT